MQCQYCKHHCQKAGRQKNGVQKLYCRPCGKYQQAIYRNRAYEQSIDPMLTELVCESVSIRGIARVLKISPGTVQCRIKKITKRITKPKIMMNRQMYEVDELRTYIGSKKNEYCLAYTLDKATGEVTIILRE